MAPSPKTRARCCASPRSSGQPVVREDDALHQVVGVDVAAARVDLVEDLLEDTAALHLDVAEQRPARQVGEDVNPGLEAGRVERGVVAGVIAGGHGVHAPARRLHGRVHGPAVRIALAAAEEQVLHEVGDPARRRMLVARPGSHVEGEHGRMEPGRPGDHDPGSVGELRPLARAGKVPPPWGNGPEGNPADVLHLASPGSRVPRLLRRRSVHWRRREPDHESGSETRLALALDGSAVLLDDLQRERQAQPGSSRLGRKEGVKDILQLFRWYA